MRHFKFDNSLDSLVEKLEYYEPHYHVSIINKNKIALLKIWRNDNCLIAALYCSEQPEAKALTENTMDHMKELLSEAAEACDFPPDDLYKFSRGLSYHGGCHVGGNYYRYEVK